MTAIYTDDNIKNHAQEYRMTHILNMGMETNRRMIAEAHPEDNCSFHSSVLNIRT
jgi:hypothetical protein